MTTMASGPPNRSGQPDHTSLSDPLWANGPQWTMGNSRSDEQTGRMTTLRPLDHTPPSDRTNAPQWTARYTG